MSFFLVFLAVVLVAAVLWAGLGRRSRKTGGAALPALLDGGFEEPPANLPPVLLPEHAAPGDIEQVRFSLGLRGYRMDQVDQVLDELRDQLAARDAELAGLRSRLAAMEQATGGDGEKDSDDGPAAAVAPREQQGPETGTETGTETGAGHGGSRASDEVAAQGKGGL
ncbi:DivIVA domain-containing protein [Arthrobacter sp. B2I5]|uniref:DivIVA domain-containing protein n=1 Tax=Arthrobacter sp. B2I5 TaxID=3042266 RepID=UPI002785E7AC|nr:DivIVA domain-containing protein [Arthrobacter sp. B2I5]MDQ0825034.1 DivIVA domain-containing protein [Arthrobacter sp. B2I5]